MKAKQVGQGENIFRKLIADEPGKNKPVAKDDISRRPYGYTPVGKERLKACLSGSTHPMCKVITSARDCLKTLGKKAAELDEHRDGLGEKKDGDEINKSPRK